MRFSDVISVALLALWQHKMRTLLSLVGVSIGTFMLATSLAIGEGVNAELEAQFSQGDRLRRIVVRPDYGVTEEELPAEELELAGDMSDERRRRMRAAKVRRWRHKHRNPKLALNDQGLETLARLDHVERIHPNVYQRFRATLGEVSLDAISIGETVGSERLRTHLTERIITGETFAADDSRAVLVHEYLVYRWGYLDEARVPDVIGQKIRIDYKPRGAGVASLLGLGGAAPAGLSGDERLALAKVMEKVLRGFVSQPRNADIPSEEFTIVGVIRDLSKQEQSQRLDLGNLGLDVDMIFPLEMARRLALRVPQRSQRGFESVDVYVDEQVNVAAVAKEIRDLKLREFSLADMVDRVRMRVTLITWVLSFLASMALLVSALGITNTMVMSVIERTHEIGIMKAVGAREGTIQIMFLIEGALVGLVGGGLGLLMSWGASIPGDSMATSMIEEGFNRSLLTDSLFIYPMLIWLGVPLLSCLITTLATVYPARRAARISPIRALRHE